METRLYVRMLLTIISDQERLVVEPGGRSHAIGAIR